MTNAERVQAVRRNGLPVSVLVTLALASAGAIWQYGRLSEKVDTIAISVEKNVDTIRALEKTLPAIGQGQRELDRKVERILNKLDSQ